MNWSFNRQVAVIGLGYVGLPLAALFARQGVGVHGIDVNDRKIEALAAGRSYLSDVSDRQIAELSQTGRFMAGSDFAAVTGADAILICVPTPLDEQSRPDLSFIFDAVRRLLPHLRQGQLVVLESSTYPGTTEDELLPLLESTGLRVGTDLALAYSPERIDPGQERFRLHEIPKVIGGVTPACTAFAACVYGAAFDRVVPVSSPRAAEMTKLLENSQRLINISFMNEMAMVAEALGINLWETIEAASTKPYGFTPYYPGPGIGGHCIPVDPMYLVWKAQQLGLSVASIETAHALNIRMGDYVVERIGKLLPPARKPADMPLLAIGVTYKKNVNDVRESMPLAIIGKLLEAGYPVSYHDPLIPEVHAAGRSMRSTALTEEALRSCGCAIILADHSSIPFETVVRFAPLVFDTRNATAGIAHEGNVRLL